MKTRNAWRLFGGLLFVALIVGILAVVGAYLLRTEVSVASTKRGAAVDAVPGVVRVAAERTVELRSEAGGRVVKSQLEVGKDVEADEAVLWLDESELQHAIERVRIDLRAEEALEEIGLLLRYDHDEAKEELVRMEELREKGEVSRRELDVQKRRVARLADEIRLEEVRKRRRIETLRNELEVLEEDVGKMTIRAPVNGTVVDVFSHPGDLVSPRSGVARLLSRERVVMATLSEEDFSGVEVGQAATVRFLSYGSRLFSAKVLKVLPSADPDTQRYTIHLDVEMPAELMVPGITGEVSVVLGERAEALTVPRRALLGREVFVVRDGRVKSQRVKTGFISLNQVEILEGLEDGDRVAVANLDRLRDGDRVRVKNDRS